MATSSSRPQKPMLPPRSASTALWGHLLQKKSASQSLPKDATISKHCPPIAPIDKAGTSMRILLHDTQANLEVFSERVHKLTDGVIDTKREISNVQKLFEHEHEKLVEESVGLANRCQLEIQKSIGEPAQAPKLEELHKEMSAVDGKLESLNKRIDVLHMLNQTQSQALQTLQDQQSQLLSALVPVLPLLQAVPLHIATIRNDIKETIQQSHYNCSQNLRARRKRDSDISTSASATLCHPSSSPLASSLPSSPSERRKRRRVDSEDMPSSFDIPDSSLESSRSSGSRPHSGASPSKSLSFPARDYFSERENSSDPQEDSSLADVLDPPAIQSTVVPPISNDQNKHLVPAVDSSAAAGSSLLQNAPNIYISGLPLAIAPSPAFVSRSVPAMPTEKTAFLAQPSTSSHVQSSPIRPTVSTSATNSKPSAVPLIRHESPPHRSHMTAQYDPRPSATLNSTPDFWQTAQAPAAPVQRVMLKDSIMTSSSFILSSGRPSARTPGAPRPSSSVAGWKLNNKPPVKPMSLKDRRACGMLNDPSLRNGGKRFIPLDDDDGDDEGEMSSS